MTRGVKKLLFFFMLKQYINFHSVRYECGVGKVTVNGDCQGRMVVDDPEDSS